MSGITPVLLRRWFLTVAGLLLAIMVAGLTYSLMPVEYTSSGTAVLVPPKKHVSNPVANPLIASDNGGLSTTASILVQGLASPTVPASLGLNPDQESFTVKSTGVPGAIDLSNQPFIYVSASSPSPWRSEQIVASVLALGRQDLVDRQRDLRVAAPDSIVLASVVDPTAAKADPALPVAAAGVALLLGVAATVTIVCVVDRVATGGPGRRREAGPDVDGLPGTPVAVRPVSTADLSDDHASERATG
jgi:hypothetical protein